MVKKQIKTEENMEIKQQSIDKLEELIESEEKKANLNKLLESVLTDIQGGHWDLYDGNKDEITSIKLNGKQIYARNPKEDIDKNSIVAIDFGTKSTVAIYRDSNGRIYPLEIGSNSNNGNRSENYENPTMIEFINFEEFLNKYNEKQGRPDTLWKDLRVSHHAKNTFVEAMRPEDLNSVLSDIKQWASSDKEIKIKDQQADYKINNFLSSKKENEVNPVELYAYYIGLNLNNMCNRKIFLKYNLSYPVTYEMDIREKIRKSFEKGIKKSLPISILEDENIMKKFAVKNFNSEPFCYAATALEQYNFFERVNEKNEEIFYSIFDFGGGTTDFDFGLLKVADHEDNYVKMESLSSGGDKYLGGENILYTLAYNVFMDKKNVERLKDKGYQIYLPENEAAPLNNREMINDTKEARNNLIKLSNSLRFIWEKGEIPSEYNSEMGELTVSLLDKNSSQSSFNFEIDEKELEDKIKKIISEGVKFFLLELKNVLNETSDIKGIDKINIFLGGNSSKSEYLRSILSEKLLEYVENKKDIEKIKVFPPLGTEEAIDLQKKMGYEIGEETFIPNCKTGVAYGSILLREGGEIEIINSKGEVPFNYIIFKKRGKKDERVLSKINPYNEWIKYRSATTIENEIYYSDDQTNLFLDTKRSNIKNMYLEDLKEEYTENDYIYIRSVSPNQIEYCVSNEELIIENKYLEEPKKINLKSEK